MSNSKPYRVFNTHPDHLSFVDFMSLSAAIKHYKQGIDRGMSYAFLVRDVDAIELKSECCESVPCCGYSGPNPIKWNPFNKVVQCHNCGAVYDLRNSKPCMEETK